MTYKNVYGFNTICTSIKNPDTRVALSQNLAQSFYILHYLLFHDNDSYEVLFNDTELEEFARHIRINGFSTDAPKIERIKRRKLKTRNSTDKDPIPYNEEGLSSKLMYKEVWKTYFMNKGHYGTEIVIPDILKKFLDSLTKYLITIEPNGKHINQKNVNTIKANLKKLFEINLIKIYTYKKEKEQEQKLEQEQKIFNSFFDFIFDEEKNPLEQAISVQTQLKQLSKNDPYAALTWILLFSLYPNIEQNDQLADILDLFSKDYAATVLIKPSIIDSDSHSYDALKFSMAEKYGYDASEIEENRCKFFDKDYKNIRLIKKSSESYRLYFKIILNIIKAAFLTHNPVSPFS